MVLQAEKKKLHYLNSSLRGLTIFYPHQVFSGLFTRKGRRIHARNLTNKLFVHIRHKYRANPVFFLKAFFERMRPKVGLYPKKIAGVTHKIPSPISYKKSVSILLRWWLHTAQKAAKGKPFFPCLVAELDAAYKSGSSQLARKRDEVHRLAHLNRPFLRFLRF